MRRFGLALAVAALMLACVPAAEASIYWHTSDDNIGRAEIGGTSPDYDFITGATYGGVATNGANLFWGNQGGVGRANLDGSGVNQNWWDTPFCGVLSVAANASHMYWLASCSSGRYIARVSTARVNQEFVVPLPGPSAAACGIAIDSTYLYWTDGDKIGRVQLSGAAPNAAWRQLTLPAGVQACGLAVDSQYVYFGLSQGSPGTSTIGRFNKDGTGAPDNSFVSGASFYGGSSNPAGLAVDGNYIYWGHQGFPAANSSIGRAPKTGGVGNASFIPGVFFPLGVAVEAGGDTSPPGATATATACLTTSTTVQAS